MHRDEILRWTGKLERYQDRLTAGDHLVAKQARLRKEETRLAAEARKSRWRKKAPKRRSRFSKLNSTGGTATECARRSSSRLESVRQALRQLEPQLAALAALRRRRDQLVAKRTALLDAVDLPLEAELQQKKRALSRKEGTVTLLSADLERIERAQAELKDARAILAEARTLISKAGSAANADILAGGLIGLGLSIYKHFKAKQAVRRAGEAQAPLRRASQLLQGLGVADPKSRLDKLVGLDSFWTNFADHPGLDARVASRLDRAHGDLHKFTSDVSRKVTELRRLRERIEQARDKARTCADQLRLDFDNRRVRSFFSVGS